MCGTANPINVRGIPCALRPHLSEGVNRKVLSSFSQHGCQSNFLDWVKNFRRDAPDIEEEELMMCPMLWCRNTFKDLDATVRHVFECPRLANGWYWCPYCKRPERFLECNKGCDIIPKPRLQKRESKLAVTFFRWLGRRRSLRKIVVTPGEVELEDTARDQRIRQGSYKRELGKSRQTIALDIDKPDLCPSNVSAGSSNAHNLKTSADAAYAGWVHEKANYPGNLSGAAEIAGGDVSEPELPSPQRINVRSLHEMFGSSQFDTAEAGSDCIDFKKLDPEAFVTPPLIDFFGASVPTDLELPTVDPVYRTTELRDRASLNIADAFTTTLPTTTSQGLQADNTCGNPPPGADTLGKSFSKSSNLFAKQWAHYPFQNSHEELVGNDTRMPSLGFDFPVPQTFSPSTPSPSLISKLSSPVSLSSGASPLTSPISSISFPTLRTQQVSDVSTATDVEDGINAWRPQRLTLPPPRPKERQSQDGLTEPGANTTSASNSDSYQWNSGGECRQVALEIQNLGAEAGHYHGPHSDAHSPQTRIQVEELQGLVRVVNNEWMQRLVPSRELRVRYSSLSARTLFIKGIDTLKTWLCGKLERTFEEVISFMHVAFAAAFILHHDDKSYSWDAFFQEALQLQHALVDRKEKLLFLTAMDRWRWLSVEQTLSSAPNPDSIVTRSVSQELSSGSNQAVLLQELRNSKVFSVCAGFLDDFEEAVIIENNLSLPGAALAAQTDLPKIGELIEKIIQPLAQTRGIEAFQASILDASFRIRGGTLRSIREVEVMLVSSGRRKSQSPEVFKRFQNYVTSQCNTAMRSSNHMWRDQYYIADLKDIMDISGESDRHRAPNFASKRWLDTSVFAVIRPSEISTGSPSSLSPRSTEAFTVDSSPTSHTTRTSTDMFQREEVSTEMTSPTTASQASTPSTPSAINVPTSNVGIPCHLCGEKFTGTPPNAKSNLTRHLRTSPKHNKDAGFLKCPEPGCPAKPTRPDNLSPHLKRRHGLTSPSDLEQAKKKSRALNPVPKTA